ncbi:MAG: hypothetical protein Q7T55_14780 [Solirubrobacteraceae bacterium]|nr:hypothetical protein [Solirubrobacteraceae bacterium]
MSTERSLPSRPTRTRAIALGAALAFTAGAAVPAVADAKTYRGEAADPAGDGPVPGRDITNVKFRYTSAGSILFVITTAGPIDPATADAGVGLSLGTTCKKLVVLGNGLFSAPDPVAFATVKGAKGKLGKPREGAGEITNNVYTLKVKHSAFKGITPGCFAVALVDPAAPEDQVPTPFDQTGEIKIKK